MAKRNPVAKSLRHPAMRQRVVQSKRKAKRQSTDELMRQIYKDFGEALKRVMDK